MNKPQTAIEMRHLVTFILFIFLCVTAFGQKRKLPPKDTYYPISKEVCEFPRQMGKLEVIQNDSTGQTTFHTDHSVMIVHDDDYVRFLAGWDKEDKREVIHYPLDSMVTFIFQNGLLTPDLLIQSFNSEAKYIDYKGDTVDWTHHVKSNTVWLRHIQQQESTKLVKHKKGALLVEVAVTFIEDTALQQLPAIHNFTFYLEGDFNPSSSNFTAYLKTARIKCLKYTGTQL